MGQVPFENLNPGSFQILLIGDGRVAKSIASLVCASNLDDDSSGRIFDHAFSQWSRKSSRSLESHLASLSSGPTHVWLAVSDNALKTFVEENASVLRKAAPTTALTFVHFAGSLPTFSAADFTVHAVHPLMTFSDSTNGATTAEFSKATLILDNEGPSLEKLMPGLSNRVHRLDPTHRTYYHALCAIAGNFSVLLWEAVSSRFEADLKIPAEALSAYRDQIFKNLANANNTSVLTGPLARGDDRTLAAHREALLKNFEVPLLKIYDGFSDLHRTDRERKRQAKELA